MEKNIKKHLDTTLSLEERVAILLEGMTLSEKCAQLHYEYITLNEAEDQNQSHAWVTKGMGHFFVNSQLSVKGTTHRLNELQKQAVQQTRLGIPLLIHCEALHGLLSKETTAFPQCITMAGSFDRELVEKVYASIAEQTRTRGMHMAYSPVLDLATDPRWGRVQETFGEDPFLVSELGVACVKGYQGRKVDVIDDHHVVCTAKHFAGYGQAQGGRNFAPFDTSMQFFREHVLLPFEKAVKEAGLLGIMPAHHDVEGVPCHSNGWLLDSVLRKDWGFEGVVVSDADDINRLETLHKVSPDQETSAKMAMEAGVDVEILHSNAYLHLKNLVKEGRLDETLIDKAVERVLALKFRLGLFEKPFVEESIAVQIMEKNSHQELAEESALASAVLLKNGDSASSQVLPLSTEAIGKLAVMGPTSDHCYYGTYSPASAKGTTILEGLRAYNESMGKAMEVSWAQGCKLMKSEEEDYETEEDMARARKNPQLLSDEDNRVYITEAVAMAKESDVVILCVGGNRFTERESVFSAGHRGDRGSLKLVGSQETLVREVVETGTPLVLIVSAGGPVELTNQVDEVDAILWSGFSGQRGGEAVAKLLFGDVNPSGKLPMTFPRSVAHLPCYHYQKPLSTFKEYLFENSTPLFPFGYGLSYTTFELTNISLEKEDIKSDEYVQISVDIRNSGARSGKETVQLYIGDDISSITRPAKELKGFEKVQLEAGESRKLAFTITPEMLSFLNAEGKRVVEAGTFTITIGTDSVSGLSKTLRVS